MFRVDDDEAISSVGAFPLTPGKDGNEEDNFLKGQVSEVIQISNGI